MDENKVVSVEESTESRDLALTGGEKVGIATVGALAVVGTVTVVKFGIKKGKEIVGKIKESKLAKETSEAVESAKVKLSKKSKKEASKDVEE